MKSSNRFSMRLGILMAVLLFFVGSALIWWKVETSAVDLLDTTPVMFQVKKGDGVKTIAANLAQKRLIRSPMSFFVLVKLLGIERQLQAGDFRLNRGMDTGVVARELTHGMLDTWVTTLEGWRVEEIATQLSRDLDIPEVEFLKYAREGYMFPDTYRIPRDASAAAITIMFRETFDRKVDAQLRADAQKQGFTLSEVVTLASIVEREGRTDDDRPVIAGILRKRLQAGWPLQTDATIQYSLGYQAGEKSWWKKELTQEDKAIRSPYNTYTNPGLPPGPIANPGLASIKAVIYPKETDYWYYLHDQTGRAHYARTIEEHERNIATYLQ